jgi:hypothetical protein
MYYGKYRASSLTKMNAAVLLADKRLNRLFLFTWNGIRQLQSIVRSGNFVMSIQRSTVVNARNETQLIRNNTVIGT